MILAIDPGNIESAYVILDYNLNPIEFEKLENTILIQILKKLRKKYGINHVAIEMVACYGMPVGKEVFDTCVWIGRFYQSLKDDDIGWDIKDIKYIYRKEEKMNLCNSMKANDSTIKQALVDRFACGVRNHGKGTKKEPGWFYGFKADCWAAYAVGVTYHDLYLKEGK